MSDESLHSEHNSPDEALRRSFASWDADMPRDLWEELDESLSIEKVWENVSESLATDNSSVDKQLQSGYGDWQPGAPADIWARLDESLSVEKVWTELDRTLTAGTLHGSWWLRIAAACILTLFFVRQVNDEQFGLRFNDFDAGKVSANVAPGSSDRGAASVVNSRANDQFPVIPVQEPAGRRGNAQDIRAAEGEQSPEEMLAGSHSWSSDTLRSVNQPADTSETVASLPYTRYAHGFGLQRCLPPVENKRYDHVLVQFGTQLANLKIASASSLSSSRTQIGIAADVAWRQRFGNLQLTGAFGVSQFRQQQGNYVNARYREAQQKINMAQLSLCLGYNFRKFHVYAGPMLSNALTAVEFNEGIITQVYAFNTVEPGATAGIDYQLLKLPGGGGDFLLGAQYQYLPDNRLNANLNQIHGFRLQAKFSF